MTGLWWLGGDYQILRGESQLGSQEKRMSDGNIFFSTSIVYYLLSDCLWHQKSGGHNIQLFVFESLTKNKNAQCCIEAQTSVLTRLD